MNHYCCCKFDDFPRPDFVTEESSAQSSQTTQGEKETGSKYPVRDGWTGSILRYQSWNRPRKSCRSHLAEETGTPPSLTPAAWQTLVSQRQQLPCPCDDAVTLGYDPPS